MRMHYCIVSEQPIPNLTAALDSRLRADALVLLTSEQMTGCAETLVGVARRHGVECRIVPLSNRLDLEAVARDVEVTLDKEISIDVVLNATGGQKPMSIAAYEVFRSRALPAFYVETNNSVTWLPPKNGRIEELETHLTIEDYLEAYGARVETISRASFTDGRIERLLVERRAEFLDALGFINGLARQAKGSLTARLDGKVSGARKYLLQSMRDAGLLKWDSLEGLVSFPDEQSRSYVVGGWLEHHVFRVVNEHRSTWNAADTAFGVKVARSGESQTLNELDVLVLAHNHLFLVECKTLRPIGARDEEDEIIQALYKLHAVRRVISGLASRAMLVSWRSAEPKHRRRADVFDVRLIDGDDLQSLPQKLALWFAARALR